MILYADLENERLDAFLARSVENLSRSGAQKLLDEGCVLRSGVPGIITAEIVALFDLL